MVTFLFPVSHTVNLPATNPAPIPRLSGVLAVLPFSDNPPFLRCWPFFFWCHTLITCLYQSPHPTAQCLSSQFSLISGNFSLLRWQPFFCLLTDHLPILIPLTHCTMVVLAVSPFSGNPFFSQMVVFLFTVSSLITCLF